MNTSYFTRNSFYNSFCSSRKEKSISQTRLKLHFKSLVKLILECQRLNSEYSLRNKENDEIIPFIQNMTFHFEVASPLMFDPSLYKADKQLKVPEEIKSILKKPCFDRTDEELYLVKIYLKGIKTVREYPIRMQEKIARFGSYEKYNCKRILVRQGHRASAFYIILSGSVIVIVMNDIGTTGGVVAYLEKGHSFGELAIIHQTKRQSTVVAKETVELLSISIKDFHEIFMSGGIKMIMDPDHDDFINSSFLSDFPKELLANSSDKFFFQYFRNNEILSRDTNNSQWIYLVKSGEISVIYLDFGKKENIEIVAENSRNLNLKPEKLKEVTTDQISQHVRTIAEDFDLAFDNVENDLKLYKDCKWIQVQRIRKKDVFGLVQCYYPNQPKFILLSKGVEVFMLDKSFFLTYCSDKSQRSIKMTLSSYPSISDIRQLISNQKEWKQYKQRILFDTLASVKCSR